jgi:1-acyl-sn-glycerol-3-phosphate acyltransferase
MPEAYRVPLYFRLSRPLLKAVFRLTFHILGKVKVIGRKNVPSGQAYIVAMNHVSIYDPPLIAAFWPEVLEIIGASDVFLQARPGTVIEALRRHPCPSWRV